MIIGAGPIIGQACDSIIQVHRPVKRSKRSVSVILVNSTATIMTDPGMADAAYIEPITPTNCGAGEERPDAASHNGRSNGAQYGFKSFNDGVWTNSMLSLSAPNLMQSQKQKMSFIPMRWMISCRSARSRAVVHIQMLLMRWILWASCIITFIPLGGEGGEVAYNRRIERLLQMVCVFLLSQKF